MTRTLPAAFGAILALTLLSTPAGSQENTTTLFKIVTVRDDIVIGLDREELAKLGGIDAGAVARALARNGEMTAWQYGVRRGADGEPRQAPVAKVGLIAHSSLRVEPYKTPYPIMPHE